MNDSKIQKALQPLIGLPLRCVGRAANMLWIHFGEYQEIPDRKGGTRSVGEWALHVHCPWRICRLGRIVVAYHDFYDSPDGAPLDDWDSPGMSQFDHQVDILSAEFESTPPLVSSVEPDDVGGFAMHLSRDYRLDVFPDDSVAGEEHWRLFQPGPEQSHHFVF
jgi:hypothetical protein